MVLYMELKVHISIKAKENIIVIREDIAIIEIMEGIMARAVVQLGLKGIIKNMLCNSGI